MYLCDLIFSSLGADEDAVSEVHLLGTRLARNGQIVGEYVVGRIGPDLRLTCVLPLPDSFDVHHHSEYVRETLSGLESRSGKPATVSVNSEHAGSSAHHLADPTAAALLVLKTSYTSVVAPLWDPGSDKHLPLYLIPITADERERVFFWERNYQRLDGLWFGAPALEVESYREMASASSALMTQGRNHAALIEAALGVPTYTWLVRHYGAPQGDGNRVCPACGESWRMPGNDYAVPFRCDPCRLASHFAFCTEKEDWVRFQAE